jgi:hypothetical protein
MSEIVPVEHQREGRAFTFTGQEPDDSGEPIGEPMSVECIVPPLNFYGLRRLEAREKVHGTKTNEDQLVDAIEEALKRNYRGVPRWLIEQTVDIGNMADFNRALRGEVSPASPAVAAQG